MKSQGSVVITLLDKKDYNQLGPFFLLCSSLDFYFWGEGMGGNLSALPESLLAGHVQVFQNRTE